MWKQECGESRSVFHNHDKQNDEEEDANARHPMLIVLPP
jgi:hypothetical protein